MTGNLVLYLDAFWSNPWDAAPYVALREKGVPFSTAIAMVGERSGVTPAIRFQAYTGLEPALQHGDFWLAESMAIIEYVEDIFPPPDWPRLFPENVRARARARQLMSWIRMELLPIREARPSILLFYKPEQLEDAMKPFDPLATRLAADLVAVVERLGASPEGALFGEWCIADVDVAFALMRLIRGGYAVPPSVAAYAEAVWRRPSVREYVEHARPPHPPRRY
ncbi:MAG TPA: glutathione transferase [Kofleriaceae bacterium]|nr:glutathione transferase [Kofleriaceae bacterium]